MADLPIPFNGAMVRAHLSGRKTQTRRVIRPQPIGHIQPILSSNHGKLEVAFGPDNRAKDGSPKWWPVKYDLGDRLWVRERTMCMGARDGEIKVRYEADGHEPDIWLPFPDRLKFRPEIGKRLSMGCYREASRITDVVTNVRIQHLKEITYGDALAEGIHLSHAIIGTNCNGGIHGEETAGYVVEDPDEFPEGYEPYDSPIDCFFELWDSLNADQGYGYTVNPWLYAISFKVTMQNIDRIGGGYD